MVRRCIKQHFFKMKRSQLYNVMHDWLRFFRKIPLTSLIEHSARVQLFWINQALFYSSLTNTKILWFIWVGILEQMLQVFDNLIRIKFTPIGMNFAMYWYLSHYRLCSLYCLTHCRLYSLQYLQDLKYTCIELTQQSKTLSTSLASWKRIRHTSVLRG